LGAAWDLAELLGLLHVFKVIAQLVHVDASERVAGAGLPSDRDRIAGEIRVSRERGERSAGGPTKAGRCTGGHGVRGCAEQVEVLSPAALAVVAAAVARSNGAGRFAFVGCLLARGEDEREVGLLDRARRAWTHRAASRRRWGALCRGTRSRGRWWADDDFFGDGGEGGEFSADDVPSTARDGERVVAVDVRSAGKFLAGECIGRSDGYTGQRRDAGLDGAVDLGLDGSGSRVRGGRFRAVRGWRWWCRWLSRGCLCAGGVDQGCGGHQGHGCATDMHHGQIPHSPGKCADRCGGPCFSVSGAVQGTMAGEGRHRCGAPG
jgi:hypothetical protein